MPYKSKCIECGSLTETNKSQWIWSKQRPKCSRCGATLGSRGKRPSKRKPNKRSKARLIPKPAALKARGDLKRLTDLAAKLGISIDYREVTTARRPTLHVMFNGGGYRLADWWPGTSKIILAGGRHATAENLDEALKLAETGMVSP